MILVIIYCDVLLRELCLVFFCFLLVVYVVSNIIMVKFFWLDEYLVGVEDWIMLLIEWCDINSGMENFDGFDRMWEWFLIDFEMFDILVEIVFLEVVMMIGEDGEEVLLLIVLVFCWKKCLDCVWSVFLCIYIDMVYVCDLKF